MRHTIQPQGLSPSNPSKTSQTDPALAPYIVPSIVNSYAPLLQSKAQTLDDRLSEPYGVRAAGRIRLTRCHPNRVQANMMLSWLDFRIVSKNTKHLFNFVL